MHAITAEDLEVSLQLLGESDHVPVEQVLGPKGAAWEVPAVAPGALEAERLLEVLDVLLVAEQQLGVLCVHDVDRVAEHHDDRCSGDAASISRAADAE